MESVLLGVVFNRLVDDPGVSDEVRDIVLAACEGSEALTERLSEETPPGVAAGGADGADHASESDPAGAYLRSVTVEGFRGVGPARTLELEPGPGLTLVVGRNGSGKSSFAEALELLLTGDSWRWKGRSQVWAEGWRNLHHAGATAIAAELAVEGEPGPTVARREWAAGAGLHDSTAWVQRHGRPREALTALGWSAHLDTYRPFLSYNELSSMLDEGPSKLYDAVSAVLGLEELVDAERLLRTERLARERAAKDVKASLAPLLDTLAASTDERARRCHSALAGRKWDLDTVEEVLAGSAEAAGVEGEVATLRRLCAVQVPDPGRARVLAGEVRTAAADVASLMGTHAGRAREVARILEQALQLHAHHGDGDCPVCGQAAALDGDWRARAEAEAAGLHEQASDAEAAHRRLHEATQASRQVLGPPPDVLGRAADVGVEAADVTQRWQALAEGAGAAGPDVLADRLERMEELAAAVVDVRASARDELELREDSWRPVARDVAAWVQAARVSDADAERVKQVKAGEEWLKRASGVIRDERFTPIAGEAKALWDVLRQQSSVELGGIELEGAANRRRLRLDVTVDGVGGAALGVMSQGELHCLALSLFLPRATLPESPFRFVVIDDPVQAMDPARVDGLARILQRVAAARQVVVFTHDDRLPESTRRLGLDARVVEVARRDRSVVSLRPALTPAQRAVEDAMALAKTDELPPAVARRVVPLFCRLALEAACTDVVRRRRIGRGEAHGEVEDALLGTPKLAPRLALALFDDAGRASEVPAALEGRFGRSKRDVYFRVNKGVHRGEEGDLVGLVRNCEALAQSLLEVR
ncbi:MAG: AAA family ATPase [Actinobacteria bacterium]|nr:AAA family ATPase [Actinomycetota bacterium]